MGVTIHYATPPTPPAPHAISVLTVPPAEEPLTVDQGKLRAGLTWTSPDPRDALMTGWIRAARSKVEHDTGLALLEQTRAAYFDAVSGLITLPAPALPLQEVVSIVAINAEGVPGTVDPADYVVDYVSGRIALAAGKSWPSNLRTFQPWTITHISGYPDVATFEVEAPLLLQAVGLLVAHYATTGRDLAVTGTIVATVPQGYDDLIAPYVPVSVA